MTPEQLKARLSGKEWKRPLLRGLDSSGLLDYIRTKLEEREEWYNKADISTPGLNADIAGLAGKILQGIS
jgi:shikimate kinase